jgi:hypothetical protein
MCHILKDVFQEMETLAQQTTEDLIDTLSSELLNEVSTFIVQANAIINSAMKSGNASIAMTSSKLKEMQFAKPGSHFIASFFVLCFMKF